MRPSAAVRQRQQQTLNSQGWTVVKISKPPVSHTQGITHIPMVRWCEKTLGPGRMEPGDNWLDGYDVWYTFSWFGYWTFHFKYDKDATAFALRWR